MPTKKTSSTTKSNTRKSTTSKQAKAEEKPSQTQNEQAAEQQEAQQPVPMPVVILQNLCMRLSRTLINNRNDSDRIMGVARKIGAENIKSMTVEFQNDHGSYVTRVSFADFDHVEIDSVNLGNISAIAFGTMSLGESLTESIESVGVGIGNDWLYYNAEQDPDAFNANDSELQLQQDLVYAVSRDNLNGLLAEPGFTNRKITIEGKIIRMVTDEQKKMFLLT